MLAQTAPEPVARANTLPTVVVTASRAPRTLGEDIADVSVITREEIERAGNQSLADLLKMQGGIEITTNGGAGSTTGLFIRGTKNAQSVLLIDGVRVDSVSAGGASWAAVPLQSIERIEILRGPASSLYGADAMGGVVQIFTRRGTDKFSGDVSVGAGSRDLYTRSGGIAGKAGLMRYSLRYGAENSGGFSAINNTASSSFVSDRDGHRSENYSASLDFDLAPGQQLSLLALSSRMNADFDAASGVKEYTVTNLKTHSLTSTNRLTQSWLSTFRLARSQNQSNTKWGYGPSRYDSWEDQAFWQHDFAIGNHALQLAYERRDENLNNTDYAHRHRATEAWSGLFQTQWDSHSVQLNMREDRNTQFGSKVTGGAAYAYKFSGAWRATIAAGTAFRAPTFSDLYYPSFDNPTLKPEYARNIETSLGYQADNTQLSATVYRNDVKDLIVFQTCPLPGRSSCPVNVNNARLEGLSLQANTRQGAWLVRGTLDFQNPRDTTSGKLLQSRSRQHGSASLTYTFAQASLGAEWTFSGYRYNDAANTVRLGGYGVVNLIATYHLAPGWELLARWNNVLDKHYELVRDYQTPRSNGYLGLRYQFGNQ